MTSQRGSLLLLLSADVRSADNVIAFEGRYFEHVPGVVVYRGLQQ